MYGNPNIVEQKFSWENVFCAVTFILCFSVILNWSFFVESLTPVRYHPPVVVTEESVSITIVVSPAGSEWMLTPRRPFWHMRPVWKENDLCMEFREDGCFRVRGSKQGVVVVKFY